MTWGTESARRSSPGVARPIALSPDRTHCWSVLRRPRLFSTPPSCVRLVWAAELYLATTQALWVRREGPARQAQKSPRGEVKVLTFYAGSPTVLREWP